MYSRPILYMPCCTHVHTSGCSFFVCNRIKKDCLVLFLISASLISKKDKHTPCTNSVPLYLQSKRIQTKSISFNLCTIRNSPNHAQFQSRDAKTYSTSRKLDNQLAPGKVALIQRLVNTGGEIQRGIAHHQVEALVASGLVHRGGHSEERQHRGALEVAPGVCLAVGELDRHFDAIRRTLCAMQD